MQQPRRLLHATDTSNLADILERVLDKGIVIAGDIKIKLVDIELLTIQVRLLIASVEKAREMGMDWWLRNPDLSSQAAPGNGGEIAELKRRIAELEQRAGSAVEARPLPAGAAAAKI
jgi:gas vesicle protein GvpA/GvpJ/GvpM family